MAAVFGDERTTYRCYYPTPRPSVEESEPRPAPPPTRTTTATGRSDAVYSEARSAAPIIGLHTPAQSKDLTQDAIVLPESTSHPSETPTADGSRQVAIQVKLLQDKIFKHHMLSTLAPLKLNVTPEIWAVLEAKMEGEGLRLHYTPSDNEESGVLIVTYPTAIHESVSYLAGPFRRIEVADTSFLCDTNTDVVVCINAKGTNAKRIPDFAFGSKDREYAVIFECGYSQSEPDLDSKVAIWFGSTTVKCVITVKFVCRDYSPPRRSKQRPLVAVSRATFVAQSQTAGSLGSVRYDDHVWAHDIKKIEAGVYCRDKQGDVQGAKFDLTPGAVDLQASQEFINSELRTSAQEFLGDAKFREIFPESAPFFIDCTRFYQAVQDAKMHDAYGRYLAWTKPSTPPVLQVTTLDAKSFRSKRARDLAGTEATDEEGRAGKMQKITGYIYIYALKGLLKVFHSFP